MATRNTLISQLYKGRHDKKLKLRVIRKWDCYNTRQGMDLMSEDFVALDEKNEAVHCSIRSRYVQDFAGLIREGGFYNIKNFTVDLAKPLYHVRRDFCILLDASTMVEEIVTNLPSIKDYFFDIVPFGELLHKSDNLKYLCDVVGCVVGISEVGKRPTATGMTPMQLLELIDIDNRKLKITLWGANMIAMASEMMSTKRRVCILTSMIVKKDDSGSLSLSNSSATKFFSEETIQEINDFMARFDVTQVEDAIAKIPMYSTLITRKEYEKKKLSIATILEMLENGSAIPMGFFTIGTIVSIDEQNGWRYNSYSKCKCKLYFSNGKLECRHCENDEPNPVIRFKLEIEIEDDGLRLKCVMFDKDVEKLVHLKAVELVNIFYEGNMENSFSQQLKQIIGLKHIFQLKLNELSRGTSREIFVVARIV